MRSFIILQSMQGEATRCDLTLKCVWFYILFSRLYKLCDDSPDDGLLRRKHAVVLATLFVVIYGNWKTVGFRENAVATVGSCCDLHMCRLMLYCSAQLGTGFDQQLCQC